MSSARIRLCCVALLGFAAGSLPAAAGIDLLTEPAPPTDQIDLQLEDYVPFSGTPSGISDDEKAEIIRACDDQAAHPGNDENPEGVAGVGYNAIDGSKALPACLAAVDAAPDNKRMRYQLARAKQASGQGRDAIKDLTALADEGYVAAINNLGATYQIGIGVKRDYARALGWYEKAANRDFVPSMAILGWMYQTGRGTAKDSEKAIEWYRKAADGGSGSSMHNLGHMYHTGSGGEINPEKAAQWFLRSAEAGFTQGMAMAGWTYQVGRGVAPDGAEAIKWYKKAASLGDLSAVSALGGFYDTGGSGTAPRPEKSAEWLLRALMEGHAPTQKRLIEASDTLRPETRRAIQSQLSALGFDAGPPDGVFGRKTREAINAAFNRP